MWGPGSCSLPGSRQKKNLNKEEVIMNQIKNRKNDWANLLISYSRDQDILFHDRGHTLIGGALLQKGEYDGEVHIFLKKGDKLVEEDKIIK